MLTPEQQLALLHEEAALYPIKLNPWLLALSLPTLAVLALLMGYVGIGLLLMGLSLAVLGIPRAERRLWGSVQRQVRSLATEVRGAESVGALLDFARWQGGDAPECHAALARLLPRLDILRCQRLTAAQRAYLRRCAENQDPTVEFTVAALLVLGSATDTATFPIARKLAVSSSSQRIRDAALLCLEELDSNKGLTLH